MKPLASVNYYQNDERLNFLETDFWQVYGDCEPRVPKRHTFIARISFAVTRLLS